MHKAFTIAIVAVMLFSSLALLSAPTARAETISNEKIGTYTLFEHDFTKDAGKDPHLVFTESNAQATPSITMTEYGARIYFRHTTSDSIVSEYVVIAAGDLATIYTYNLTVVFEKGYKISDIGISIDLHGRALSANTFTWAAIFYNGNTENTHKLQVWTTELASNSPNTETLGDDYIDDTHYKYYVHLRINGVNHTIGVQLANLTTSTNWVYVQMPYAAPYTY
ncbi:MAG: hypothetical protein J7L63_05100, partial [Thermoplasmata archaeon]|nr:hypothetical protein [Thermoplasmata archaeon]